MGWARGDDYRVDSPAPAPGPVPKTTNATPIAPTHRPVASTGAQRAGRARDRRHRNRRPKDSGCKNPQVGNGPDPLHTDLDKYVFRVVGLLAS